MSGLVVKSSLKSRQSRRGQTSHLSYTATRKPQRGPLLVRGTMGTALASHATQKYLCSESLSDERTPEL